jgi:hypothetical protein
MPTENQIAYLERRKKETKDNLNSAYKALTFLSKDKQDGFVSTVEVSCFLFPKCNYENIIGPDGRSYIQNSMSSTVMNWLKRLEKEGRIETKLLFGNRVYKPILSDSFNL